MSKTLKEKALKIVEAKNLCSYMNDTKWNELRFAVLNELPFPPPYIMKTLFETSCPAEANFQHDVWYLGDWYEGLSYKNYFHGGFAIEWLKVRPRYLKHRGQLIEPEIIEETAEFEEILRRYNIPFSIENGMHCIYGYR